MRTIRSRPTSTTRTKLCTVQIHHARATMVALLAEGPVNCGRQRHGAEEVDFGI